MCTWNNNIKTSNYKLFTNKTLKSMTIDCMSSEFVLPSVSVEVGETIREEG